MIEFTTSEFIFLIWNIVVTGFAFKYHHELEVAKYIAHKIITDKDIRDRIVADYESTQKDT
jgi:hypothetical protein